MSLFFGQLALFAQVFLNGEKRLRGRDPLISLCNLFKRRNDVRLRSESDLLLFLRRGERFTTAAGFSFLGHDLKYTAILDK